MSVNSVDIFLNRPRNILNFFALWFTPSNGSIYYTVKRILTLLTQYSFIFFEVIFIVLVWGDLAEVSQASNLLFTQASVCYKCTLFIVKKKNLRDLLDFMEIDIFIPQSVVQENILSKNARKVNNLCGGFLLSALTACTLWTINPLLDISLRQFPFKIWMPVDAMKSPEYELGFMYQVLSIYISAFLFCSVDGISLSMIQFGCAQMEIIIDKIQNIKNVPLSVKSKPGDYKKAIDDNKKLFVECVRQHQSVVRFIELLEDTYHTSIFFQVCGSVVIICIIGLCITIAKTSSVEFYSMIFYLMTMLSQLLLYCFFGSELTTGSENLRSCLYQSPWYDQDVSFRRSLIITMENMKKPIIFKPGHYISLSRPTFVSILRTSYSYFAVLNQANNK